MSGMGTPDILGTYGTFSFFTDDPAYLAMDISGGQVIPVELKDNRIETAFIGPKNTFLKDRPDMTRPFTVSFDPENKTAIITIEGNAILLGEGEWSPWFEVTFDALGPFQKVSGITRFYMKSFSPHFMLYAGPINIGGLLFFYFSTLDLATHMLWRNFDPMHPAHNEEAARDAGQIEKYYTQIDSVLGAVRQKLPPNTVLMIMSDHGFSPYYYKFNLNTWLYENDYIALLDPSNVVNDPLFRNVFWRRTRAFGLGINGLYINVRGRDAEGIVDAGGSYDALVKEICDKLLAYRDPRTGLPVVRSVHARDETYHGGRTDLAPDIVVGYDRGYRCSDESALGAFSEEILQPNMSKWSGDHCMSNEVVPGVFLSNRPLLVADPALTDFAATVLA